MVHIGIVVAAIVSIAANTIDNASLSADKVPNGRYTATVEFKNPKTHKVERYKMQVMVESDRIVMIDFGNGESVHAGYNNTGYNYSGGRLKFEWDWSANVITVASGTVRVIQKSGDVIRFKVRIAP